MPKARSYPTTLMGAQTAADFRGLPTEAAKTMREFNIRPKKCRCENPWLERQEDGVAHCVNCGCDL